MDKYLHIFKISLQQEFAYRLNFVMWRVRNVFQVFLVFFLWDSVFAASGRVVFGYSREKILTYVFILIIIRSIVLSMRSIDIGPEIAHGDVSNVLLKPVSYFKYWLARDLSSKSLNLAFAVVESVILFIILKPPFFVQGSIIYLFFFLASLIIAMMLYFLLVILFSLPTFWFPQQSWGFMFLLMVFVEILAGGIFPLDILPTAFQNVIYLTPFPYLLFIPINLYLGKFEMTMAIKFLLISLGWVFLLVNLNKRVWLAGLKIYRSEGR